MPQELSKQCLRLVEIVSLDSVVRWAESPRRLGGNPPTIAQKVEDHCQERARYGI